MVFKDEFNSVLLSLIDLFRKNCDINFQKKSFFLVKDNFSLNDSAINFSISNHTNFDFYISLPSKFKEKLFSTFITKNDEKFNINNKSNLENICKNFKEELTNIFAVKFFNQRNSIKISNINYIDFLDQINYEKMIVIQLSSEDQDIFLSLVLIN